MRNFLFTAMLLSLCAGFISCNDDNEEEPQNQTGNPATPEVDEYGIAISQEVDLGLSVNWAGWNIGASKPEEYGGYYAWGETEEKAEYTWETYRLYDSGSFIKYNKNSYYGTIDNKTILDAEDDAAHVAWGNGWRMPTRSECVELTSCTWTSMSYKGINGFKVTGKNGNSIFLPASGFISDTGIIALGKYCIYWTSTLCSSSDTAWSFDDERDFSDDRRYTGNSIRAVKNK